MHEIYLQIDITKYILKFTKFIYNIYNVCIFESTK